MKNSEIHEISNIISKELRLFSDPVRLIVPKLLAYAKNRRDFFILFEISKFQSTRNLILNIIKKDQNVMKKLEELVKKRTNKTLIKKINFSLKKLRENKKIN
tara:strand:- start:191 stop:496 length:306 start_codon:yes stop_codon:yes gene_type:complete